MVDTTNMTHTQMVDYIVRYYNKHFAWQRMVYDQEIDRTLVDAMSDEELRDFIAKNCTKE